MTLVPVPEEWCVVFYDQDTYESTLLRIDIPDSVLEDSEFKGRIKQLHLSERGYWIEFDTEEEAIQFKLKYL